MREKLMAGLMVLAGIAPACGDTIKESEDDCPQPVTVAYDGGTAGFLVPAADGDAGPGAVGDHGLGSTCEALCPAGYMDCILVTETQVQCRVGCL